MKYLSLTALVLLLSTTLYASEKAPEYYAAHFEVEKVEPICPARAGMPTCMAIGVFVTLKATLGCADALLFSDVEYRGPNLYVVSVVKQHPDSKHIRCIRANVVTKKITVAQNFFNYNVHNLGVEIAY